jgi:hypothetical protein
MKKCFAGENLDFGILSILNVSGHVLDYATLSEKAKAIYMPPSSALKQCCLRRVLANECSSCIMGCWETIPS